MVSRMTLLLLLILVGCSVEQAQTVTPPLRITAPADGATVQAGQGIVVRVEPLAGETFSMIRIAGFENLSPTASDSNEFLVQLPPTQAPGRYRLTAIGISAGQGPKYSPPVYINVESSVAITQLRVEPAHPTFHSVGDEVQLRVVGESADGEVTLTEVANYSSLDPHVVQVDDAGLLTATGSGSSAIKISYQNLSLVLNIAISNTK